MNEKEAVLCIKRNCLPPSWVAPKAVHPMGIEQFCTTCRNAGFQFRQREAVESDPSFKQIIPYILFQTDDRASMAVYRRSGSEKRLHELWSVGIGGHINPDDGSDVLQDFKTVLIAGMNRELSEEIIVRPDEAACEFIGMINEEMTEVGSVHLGAVFRISTAEPERVEPGEELSDFQWMTTEKIEALNLELWSRLAMELLA